MPRARFLDSLVEDDEAVAHTAPHSRHAMEQRRWVHSSLTFAPLDPTHCTLDEAEQDAAMVVAVMREGNVSCQLGSVCVEAKPRPRHGRIATYKALAHHEPRPSF